MRVLKDALEFEWDDGNRGKNSQKHGVTDQESEEAFFDAERKILRDTPHSEIEERYILIGKTKQGKTLFTVFTLRKNRVRVISSRRINKKSRNYMKKKLKLPKLRNEDAERDFWSSIKLNDYFEPRDFEPVAFPNLKPSSQPISIRLPSPLLFRIKERANELGVPYQAFIKNALAEKLEAKH